MVLSQVVKAGNILNYDIVKHYLETENSYKGIASTSKSTDLILQEPIRNYGSTVNNMPKLTYEFAIPEEAYGGIKAFQDELLKLAEKHGMIIN